MDVPRYKFDRYKQRRERGEWMEEGARNDSRWLSGGVPDPTYLLTLSLSFSLSPLSSTPAMEHARSTVHYRGTPFRSTAVWGRFDCLPSYF